MSSLLVALTLTPALCLILLPKVSDKKESRVQSKLKDWYSSLLPTLIHNSRRVLGILTIALFITVAIIPFLGEQFLPDFKEYDFLMHWVEKPGTSIEAMDRITIAASKELRSIVGVRNFGAHIGRAEVADEVVGPNFTELWISLDPDVDYDAKVLKFRK